MSDWRELSNLPELQTCALAAVAEHVLGRIDSSLPEAQFLLAQYRAAGEASWREAFVAALSAEQSRPLAEISRRLSLSAHEILAVILALLVEENPVVGRVLAQVQSPVGGPRPTLGLIASLMDGTALVGLAAGPAITSGLLRMIDESKPLTERAVSLPLHLCAALSGIDGQAIQMPGTTIGPDELIPLPESLCSAARQHAASLGCELLILRTNSQAEGQSLAVEIATHMGLRSLFIRAENTPGLGPYLHLCHLLPVYAFDLGPGEKKTIPTIPFYDGPVLCIADRDGHIDMPGRLTVSWTVPLPARDERYQLWLDATADPELARRLARDHRHHSERIARLRQSARYYSALDRRDRLSAEDIQAALRAGDGAGLSSLAQSIPDDIPDEALIVPGNVRSGLDLLLLRCRMRDYLVETLGISATTRYSPGVRALFVGPSGTGKTLGAGWLATRLGLPLFRVDLASITSKYIGETEKNLALLLNRAERAEVVLLFDEADSMFGRRTEVKDSNDRFANAQTNYLLQRIETFDGIVILTSNSRQRFDSAFTRRLDLILEFPLPSPEERRAIWLSHLGSSGHTLNQRAINQLAAIVDLAGGHIRNAVLTAAVLAHAQDRPIRYEDVVRGLGLECDKLGRQLPAGLEVGT